MIHYEVRLTCPPKHHAKAEAEHYRTRVWLVLVSAMLFVGCDGPLADNKLLMQSAIDPNPEVVWDSVTWIVTRNIEE